jgi:hypothetical protein
MMRSLRTCCRKDSFYGVSSSSRRETIAIRQSHDCLRHDLPRGGLTRGIKAHQDRLLADRLLVFLRIWFGGVLLMSRVLLPR